MRSVLRRVGVRAFAEIGWDDSHSGTSKPSLFGSEPSDLGPTGAGSSTGASAVVFIVFASAKVLGDVAVGVLS